MRIAACQMVSGTDIQANLSTARALIDSAAQSGAELVVLPEYFALMPKTDQELLDMAEDFENGPVQKAMSEAAQQAQVWLVAGTHPLKDDDDKHFIAACIVHNPNGEVASLYDKIHLFQFARGEERYHEGQTTQAGKEVKSVDIETWEGIGKVGLSVCFDLRFPELFRKLGTPDIITLPAAFTTFTGRAHWDALLRARAIENQCYVLACAQGGVHESGRQTWGHSILIDPWGATVAELTQGEGVLLGEVYENRIKQAREILPALKSRTL